MKRVILSVTVFLWVATVHAEVPEKKEIDRNKLNSLGDKKFRMSALGGGDFTAKENTLMKKAFKSKQSSLFSKKEAPGFGGSVPLKMATIQKEFQTKNFTQFDRTNSFLKAQQRFDTTKSSPYSTKSIVKESEKTSSLDGKQYQGREAGIIKRHLNGLQQQQFDKLDLDEAALSVEQIREMLNKE